MNAIERADSIIKDILDNHLPRIKEGLEKGYVDENQVLVVYDHLVRARVLREHNFEMEADRIGARIDPDALPPFIGPAHTVELAVEMLKKDKVKGKFAGTPKEVGGVPVPKPLRGEREHAAMLDEANFNQPHVEKLACVCGGIIKDDPQFTGDVFLTCDSCGRTFLSEFDLADVRKTEVKTPTRCPDATYFTTGTLAGGTNPVAMETEINLNGRKTTIKAKNGKFTLTYEEIVRLAVNQRRDPLNAFTGSDADLPHETVTYGHRVPFKDLPGERDGSLWKGKSVECTPGMCITCIGTGNA